MAKVFLGVPLYNWQLDFGCARSVFHNPSSKHEVFVMLSTSSLLNAGCNTLLASALTAHEKQGVEWFAMLHSDIDPGIGWLDKLIDLAEAHGADFMSAVVPIKDGTGLTSTALSDPDDEWNPWFRLTLRQALHESFPETFDAESAGKALESLPDDLACPGPPPGSRLLANTGCMVFRIGDHLAKSGISCLRHAKLYRESPVFFESRDRLVRHTDGTWEVDTWSEDWAFSEKIQDLGGKVMCTTALNVTHKGSAKFEAGVAAGNARDYASFLVREGTPHVCTID